MSSSSGSALTTFFFLSGDAEAESLRAFFFAGTGVPFSSSSSSAAALAVPFVSFLPFDFLPVPPVTGVARLRPAVVPVPGVLGVEGVLGVCNCR